jgi:outer membrane protein assembly factor BamB
MRTVEGVLQQVAEEIEGTIQASPVVAGNMVYIASEGNRVTEEGLLVALNKETGAEVWQQTVNEPLYTTPLVVGDTIVVAMAGEGPLLVAFDLETGGQKWVYSPAQ